MLDTILIVDSDATQRHIAKHAISEKLKYNTVTASSGRDAVDLVLSPGSNISLMLLDMRGGQLDPIGVIRSIKLHRPDFPIIILTEYGDHNRASEAIHAGANDFLTKPVAVERLGLSVANALRICHLCKIIEQLEQKLENSLGDFTESASMRTPGFTVFNSSPLIDGKVRKLRSLEEDAIRFALNICGGSMSKAARSLGIGRSTLYRKVSEMERHNGKSSGNQSVRENQTARPTISISEMEHS